LKALRILAVAIIISLLAPVVLAEGKKMEKFKVIKVIKAKKRKPVDKVQRWRSLVKKYFPAKEIKNALLIIKLESKGDPNAVGKTNDHGLFQIHAPSHKDKYKNIKQLYNPEFNVKVAKIIWKQSGWRPWTTARKAGLV